MLVKLIKQIKHNFLECLLVVPPGRGGGGGRYSHISSIRNGGFSTGGSWWIMWIHNGGDVIAMNRSVEPK